METQLSPSTASPSAASDEQRARDAVVAALLQADGAAGRRPILEQAAGRVPADDLLILLKAASEQYYAINAHDSLHLAEAVIEAAELTGRREHQPLGMMGAADALRTLGRYQEAVELYDRAGERFLAQGDEVGWARTRSGWLAASHFLGRGLAALAVMEPAYAVLVRHEEWSRAAGMDQSMAGLYFLHGRYEEALRRYDRAQRLLEDLGAAVETRAARAKANRASILTLLGEFAAALALHGEAQETYRRHHETLSVIRQTQAIAEIHESQGDYTRALHLYTEALAAFERDGHEADAASVALNMVNCYLSLNRNTEALALGEETLARLAGHDSPTETARAHFACAIGRARLGDTARALAMLGEAAEIFDATGLIGQYAITRLQRAVLHLGEEDWAAARDEAGAAGAIFAARGLIVRQAQATLARARAELELGDLATATDLAGAALRIVEERALPWLGHECHHLLARVAKASGDFPAALAACRAAIASIEQVQSRLAIDLRGNFLADKLQTYHDAIDCCLRLPEPDAGAAFGLLERSKSRALVDYLASNPEVRVRPGDPDDRELLAALAGLRAEHHWFYRRLYERDIAGGGDQPASGGDAVAPEAAVLQAQLRDRERQISRVLERLALRQARGLEGYTSPAVDWDGIRPHLGAGAILLEYYVHQEGCLVFAVDERGVRAIDLPTTLGEVRRLLQRWQLNLDATARALRGGQPMGGLARNTLGLLQAFHRALIAPLARELGGRERVIVVPFGPLHHAPFSAFHDGERFLIERLEVSASPSCRLLNLCLERPRRGGGRALVLAYSDRGRLPHVLAEARAVARSVPGDCFVEAAATRDVLAREAARHAILHLATHGEARLDNPAFAHLQLADGPLSPADVFNLPLDGALVVLSACETGRAAVVGGDELIGLGRGFLHAGASTLVQSLWRVEDGSTAALMTHFYGALGAGAAAGEALRGAQLALLHGQAAHPYFWAPFQLIGDRGPRESARHP